MQTMKIFSLSFVAGLAFAIPAESGKHLLDQKTFSAIAAEFSGESAQENTRQIIQYHRIQGSRMMAEVAEKVVMARLLSTGLEASIEQFPSDGHTRYQTYTSPMGWEIRGGELWVEEASGTPSFQPMRICRYQDVPMCVSTYSKGGKWSGELVDVGSGLADADYSGKDLRGKVALASGYAENVVREAVIKRGAVGVVIYPDPLDRPGHPDMVLYNGIWPLADELDKTSGGFQISTNQYSLLKSLMLRGPVRVRGVIDATLGPGQLTIVHGYIRGTSHPEKEVLLTAHLDHPKWSANDNASGSGLMIEVARTLKALIAAGKTPPPAATIHFMWVPEYYGTVAYVTRHPGLRPCSELLESAPLETSREKSPCTIANINLDMVGEDTVKTDSHFYMTRNPDSVPSALDALLESLLEQTKEADLYAPTGTRNSWTAEMSSYTQGSDHDVFLGLGIPSSMFGHAPEWTHHTSEDTLDKTDASEFLRTGVLATGAAAWLSTENLDNMALHLRSNAARLSEYARRTARMAAAAPLTESGKSRLQYCLNAMSALTQNLKQATDAVMSGKVEAQSDGSVRISGGMAGGEYGIAGPCPTWICPGLPGDGPRRLALIPIHESVLRELTGEDQKWVDAQAARFSGGPGLSLLLFEAMRFMDGRRAADQIAAALSAEYDLDVDRAWVDRLVQVLSGRGLVSPK